MLKEFPQELQGKTECPWTENLFKVDTASKKLDKERASIFYTFVMKAMFVCKRARQDIQPRVAFLSTRVREPTEQDWSKLVRIMDFLKRTQDDVAKLYADDTQTIK
jgi:hypothetical protein